MTTKPKGKIPAVAPEIPIPLGIQRCLSIATGLTEVDTTDARRVPVSHPKQRHSELSDALLGGSGRSRQYYFNRGARMDDAIEHPLSGLLHRDAELRFVALHQQVPGTVKSTD